MQEGTHILMPLVRGRTSIFVDVANVFYSQRTLGWRISYERLREYLAAECLIANAFVYTATDSSRPTQEKFLALLARAGYIVRTKPVKRIRTASGMDEWKGNLDIELAIDMLDTASSYDTAILMSGDSDFATVVDRIKAKGKRIIVISCKGHVSKELLTRARYVNLKKLRPYIELIKQNPPA